MSFFENTRKPVGLGGKIMVAMMFAPPPQPQSSTLASGAAFRN